MKKCSWNPASSEFWRTPPSCHWERLGPGTLCCSVCTWTNVSSSNKIQIDCCCCCCLVASVRSDSVQSYEPAKLLCPCDHLGKSIRVGCYALLQGIFPTQGSNLGLLHCRQSLPLSHQGSPQINHKGLKIAVWCAVGENMDKNYKKTKKNKTKQKKTSKQNKPSAATSEELRGKARCQESKTDYHTRPCTQFNQRGIRWHLSHSWWLTPRHSPTSTQ